MLTLLSVMLLLVDSTIPLKIKVGMIGFEHYQPDALAFSRSAGILPYAIKNLRDDGILNDIDFEFFWRIIDCSYYSKSNATAQTIEFIQEESVDLLIAAPCMKFILPAGALSTYYKIPILTYGYAYDTALTDGERFPYMATIVPTVSSLAVAFIGVMKTLEWTNFSLITSSNGEYCSSIISGVEQQTSQVGMTTSGRWILDPSNTSSYISMLQWISKRCRVFVFCGQTSAEKRQFLILADEAGLNTPDYVFIYLEMRSLAFGQFEALGERKLGTGRSPFYLDLLTNNADGKDAVAEKMARLAFVIDTVFDLTLNIDCDALRNAVVDGVRGPRFNCTTTECMTNQNNTVTLFANHLHDVFYNYAIALNKTLQIHDGNWNPEDLMKNMQNNFSGLSGTVVINSFGLRQAVFQLTSLKEALLGESRYRIFIHGNQSEMVPFAASYSDMWGSRNGFRPLNVPRCGFSGTECPLTTWEQYSVVIIVCAILFILILLALFFSLIFISAQKRGERRREDEGWKVSYHRLVAPRDADKDEFKSNRSMSSNPSTYTRTSNQSKGNKHSFNVMYLDEEPLIVLKFVVNLKSLNDNRAEMVVMRKLDHENLNKFIGLSIDVAPYCALWKYCERGTLKEAIANNVGRLDGFFMFSMINNIVNGLGYLHRSPIHFHGNLNSTTCYVNDRWEVKISCYGLQFAPSLEPEEKMDILYKAPEILRGFRPSKECDVYSFAIIATEILTLKPPYASTGNGDESIEELVYFIKKGGTHPKRPQLKPEEQLEINIALLHLIRDCWSEEPDTRPTMATARSLLRSMRHGKQQNLMDYAMTQMEEYAARLEQEVEDQSRELNEEKKRSDVLLYRMLPKTVADRLKLGQGVEPESFDTVTVFFSDLVKFTQLSAKCTPYQIVNLLNELFTTFDNLIDKHGVYKVETIGDGYLCVSGLPYRNGTQHVRHISEMSIDFIEACQAFRINHLPKERVQLRIGMNSGPCVAGVVGLAMPRYCLFGDVVNTGSRMESNGKPDRIHMTASANALLVALGGYVTESRGDVIIKGKGVMETFWLLGRQGEVVCEEQRRTGFLNRNRPSSEEQKQREDTIELIESSSIVSVTPPTHRLMSELDTPPRTPDGSEPEGMYENFRNDDF